MSYTFPHHSDRFQEIDFAGRCDLSPHDFGQACQISASESSRFSPL